MARHSANAAGAPRFSLVIPVRNGGSLYRQCLESIAAQSLKPSEVLVFDTESDDGSAALAKVILKNIPVRTFHVARSQFDHGGTRNIALKTTRYAWALFMTQDAICADSETFAHLLKATRVPNVVAAYGRQLPHHDASPLAATARGFNYGAERIVQDMAAAPRLGIKTWFCSNSFCLWHKPTLERAGGFAEKLILGEDMHAAARLIQAGGRIIYEPSARVRHSHNYSALEEFRRYFDTGVFHRLHRALLFSAGNPSKEGLRFVLGQLKQLLGQGAWLSVLRLPFHVAAKFLGYKLGENYTLLGRRLSRALSMHKNFWN
ncbi:MAG: O antigen biosynthesis rhamnosyltransferase RfbN [Turneriella sp.]